MAESRATKLSEAVTQLRIAANAVQVALGVLNVGFTVCDTCDSKHYSNRAEALAYKALDEFPTRLNTWAAKLEHGWEPGKGQDV